MPLKPPDQKEFLKALRMCLGGEVRSKVEENPKLPSFAKATKGTYVCFYSAVDGAPHAAIVADLTAAVSLGGALATLPIGVLKEQIKVSTPNEMVVDALSEVFNMLAGVINKTGGPHVRAGAAQQLQPPKAGSAEAWLLTPAWRHDYVCTFQAGEGRVSLLGK